MKSDASSCLIALRTLSLTTPGVTVEPDQLCAAEDATATSIILQQGNEQFVSRRCCVLQPLGLGRKDLCSLWLWPWWPKGALGALCAGPYRQVPGTDVHGWVLRRQGRYGSRGCSGGQGEPGSPLWPGDTPGSSPRRCEQGRGAAGRHREGRCVPAGCGERAKGETRQVRVGGCSSPSHTAQLQHPQS